MTWYPDHIWEEYRGRYATGRDPFTWDEIDQMIFDSIPCNQPKPEDPDGDEAGQDDSP